MYKMVSVVKEGIAFYGIEGDDIRLEDLGTDQESVAHLVAHCNQGELASFQLLDVAYDFVTQQSM